jgi:hypothetical protein
MQTLYMCGELRLAGVHSAGTAALHMGVAIDSSSSDPENAATFEAVVRAERMNQSNERQSSPTYGCRSPPKSR